MPIDIFFQLSNACKFIFTRIGDYVKPHIAERNAQIERDTNDMQNFRLQTRAEEKQKVEDQNRLQMLSNLKNLLEPESSAERRTTRRYFTF